MKIHSRAAIQRIAEIVDESIVRLNISIAWADSPRKQARLAKSQQWSVAAHKLVSLSMPSGIPGHILLFPIESELLTAYEDLADLER